MEEKLAEIVGDWTVLLFAQLCHTSSLSPNILRQQISYIQGRAKIKENGIPVELSYSYFLKYSFEELKQQFASTSSIIMAFLSIESFPLLFSKLVKIVHVVFSISLKEYEEIVEKSMHTSDITEKEILTPTDIFQIEVFHFLSSYFNYATKVIMDMKNIDIEIIPMLFHFLNHDFKYSLRKAVGQVLGSLSFYPNYFQSISDYFWKEFGKCKTNDGYRNFSSWIDGITNLKFSISTMAFTDVTVHFLGVFIGSSKRIERGILRIKFLDAVLAIYEKVKTSNFSSFHPDLTRLAGNIWDVCIQWSKKSKHSSFCIRFLCNFVSLMPKDMYISKIQQLISIEQKTLRPGDDDFLNVLLSIAKITNPVFVKQGVEYESFIRNQVMTSLFGSKLKLLRYNKMDHIPIVASILAEIGIRKFEILIDIIHQLFSQDLCVENSSSRIVLLNCLKEISMKNPLIITQNAKDLYNDLLCVIDQKNTSEILSLLSITPFIVQGLSEGFELMIENIFKIVCSEESLLYEKALHSFIECIVNANYMFDGNVSLLSMVKSLFEQYFSKHNILTLNSIHIIVSSFEKIISSIDIKSRILNIKNNWVNFRIDVDCNNLVLFFNQNKDVNRYSRLISKGLCTTNVKRLDALCFFDCMTVSYWLSGEEEIDKSQYPFSMSKQEYLELFSEYLVNYLIVHYKSNELQKLVQFVLSCSKPDNKRIGDCMKLIIENSKILNMHQILSSMKEDLWTLLFSYLSSSFKDDPFSALPFYYIISQHPNYEKHNHIVYNHFYHFIETSLKSFEKFKAIDKIHLVSIVSGLLNSSDEYFASFSKDLKIIFCVIDGLLTEYSKDLSKYEVETSIFGFAMVFFGKYPIKSSEDFDLIFSCLKKILTTINNFDLCQKMIDVVSNILYKNSQYLPSVASLSIIESIFTTYLLLAVSNLLLFCDNEINFGIIIALILIHSANPDTLVKKAVIKLYLVTQKLYSRFYLNEIASDEKIIIDSEDFLGKIIQRDQIQIGIIKDIQSTVLESAFLFSLHSINALKQSSPDSLLAITRMLPLVYESIKLENIIEISIKSMNNSPCPDIYEYIMFWDSLFNLNSGRLDDVLSFLNLLIDREESKSIISISIDLLAFISIKHPLELSKFIMGILFKKSLKEIIESVYHQNQSKYILICISVIAEALLVQESIEGIKAIIGEYLINLVFLAISVYHIEDPYSISSVSLLDSLLESTLLKCTTNINDFQEKHQELQQVGLGCQNMNVRRFLCYDSNAISLICRQLESFQNGFLVSFFESIFDVCLSSEISELLFILIPLSDLVDQTYYQRLFMFSIDAYSSKKIELFDPIIDILCVCNKKSCGQAHNCIALFLLLLAENPKRSFIQHVSEAIIAFDPYIQDILDFSVFDKEKESDYWITSVFVSVLRKIDTFSDPLIIVIDNMVNMIANHCGEQSWTKIISQMIHGSRLYLSGVFDQEFSSFSLFFEPIIDLCRKKNCPIYPIQFAVSLIKEFMTEDALKEEFCANIVHYTLESIELELISDYLKPLLHLLFMLPPSCKEETKLLISKSLRLLLEYGIQFQYPPLSIMKNKRRYNGKTREVMAVQRELLPFISLPVTRFPQILESLKNNLN